MVKILSKPVYTTARQSFLEESNDVDLKSKRENTIFLNFTCIIEVQKTAGDFPGRNLVANDVTILSDQFTQ